MAFSTRLKRRISQEQLLSTNGGDSSTPSVLSSSLQVPMPPQPTISLHANGRARLIFRPDPTLFEGVLISEDGEETFSITGTPNKKFLSEDNKRRLVDVSITDGETGQLYIIRRVDLHPPRASADEDEDVVLDESDLFKTLSKPQNFKALKERAEAELGLGLALDAGSHTVLHDSTHEVPHYELRSEVLQFSTDEILIGNRADKEIRAYLNPALVGRLLNVHVGNMRVAFSTAITPPPTPVYERRRRRSSCHVSICANNVEGTIGLPETVSEPTDADINFLM